ncbi:DUF3854 domain-containing protein, partial [bacterium]
MSKGSGIDDYTIGKRGYRTVNDPKELLVLGFSEAQAATVPGYLIPLWGVDGEIVGHQFKPDNPRTGKKGKPLKYETPKGWKMRLDVGPFGKDWVGDPNVPAICTEGVKKGDSGATRGLKAITLIGVWNWRGTNEKGGSVELADWEAIALKGRVVTLLFDADVVRQPSVASALRRLAGFLRRRGAIVKVVVPPDVAGIAKTGLDDFLVASNGDLVKLMDNRADWILDDGSIVVNGRSLADVVSDAMKALVDGNIPPNIFVRANELVR